MSDKRWQFWIDRGGTFTDIVARRPDGKLLIHKLLSDNPGQYQDAALQGIRDLLPESEQAAFAEQISFIKMGTTVGTNALLERQGVATALLITQGFKDCLRIGYQNRPDIFALNIRLPELLYKAVVEIKERHSAQGEVLQALDIEDSTEQLKTLYASGIRSVAIVLMHAWQFPGHERRLAELARSIGFAQISVSHQVSPLMKIVGRGDTTVVDAYLSPLLKRYVAQIAAGLSSPKQKQQPSPVRLMFMQSNGGLTEAGHFQGKDSILSGPAGGIIGAVAVAKKAGFNKIITFDMGGTSTDVAHYAGELERSFETEVAGVRMRAPMMHIHTVAAGGSSILSFDGIRYRVGPDSAGANPGPASYRRGGPLTVTDANVLLGKLPCFPAVFGPHADQALDSATVKLRFADLAQQISKQTGEKQSPEQVAEGFFKVAIENMASAIKKISVQKGYNVKHYSLCCFGAAAGQHACRVADRLGMRQIMLHPFAGVLSAYGMGLANFRVIKEQALEVSWQDCSKENFQAVIKRLEHSGRKELLAQGVMTVAIHIEKSVFIRYHGTDTSLPVNYADQHAMKQDFQQKFKQQFGFFYPDKSLIIEKVSVEVIGVDETVDNQMFDGPTEDVGQNLNPIMMTRLFMHDAFHSAPVYQRQQISRHCVIQGPAIIVEQTGTTVLEPGWQATLNQNWDLLLKRVAELPKQTAIGTKADPVMLEIFNKLFMSIAEQMGFVLQNTAYSVNIKERLDFSCAIFDSSAQLVANAPHIPVHLGSMGESVKALVKAQQSALRAGDVYLLNSPYHGGTHLPDITVVTPVFAKDDKTLLFFVAARGHHADIGGITPGSMPSNSLSIADEGVLSEGLKIVSGGRFQIQKVLQWLTSGPHPARNPEQNIADLQAQIAANEKGLQELLKMVDSYTLRTVKAYMQHVQNNAAEHVRKVLAVLHNGSFTYVMDDGTKIVVKITINKPLRKAIIDFTGTSAQRQSNFNAPAAVCKAAVLYVFRTLVQDDIPLNEGCLLPLEIKIPQKSLLNPEPPAAVVAGNVETSQTIVDALYGALGILAGSQGTMNNFTFGDHTYQYYETICGGTGAGKNFNGCDAVHSHMTNSRITDPEVLEWRFPVILEAYSIRTGSGGSGHYKGGNGVLRRIRFLQAMKVSILSSHRIYPTFGMAGGNPGKTGRNTYIDKKGIKHPLPGCTQLDVQINEVIQIETPGGGGFGAVSPAKPKNNNSLD